MKCELAAIKELVKNSAGSSASESKKLESTEAKYLSDEVDKVNLRLSWLEEMIDRK